MPTTWPICSKAASEGGLHAGRTFRLTAGRDVITMSAWERDLHCTEGKPMIRVLIADDHAIVRGGFRQFVADEPDMCVAAEAATGDATISLVREQAFDVVLLDIAMPDKNGIDTLRIIKQVRPEQGVLILSGYPESQYAINLLRAGANGYLNKDCEPDEIVRAIRPTRSPTISTSPRRAVRTRPYRSGNSRSSASSRQGRFPRISRRNCICR
jgi:two-component system invasion response regulator UvrY